jgi:hypothetical protein
LHFQGSSLIITKDYNAQAHRQETSNAQVNLQETSFAQAHTQETSNNLHVKTEYMNIDIQINVQ